jgi:hypothetical protein
MKRWASGFAFFMMVCGTFLFADGKSGCIAGTYLVVEASGAQSLWTFSKDGTIQSASSAQGAFNFSQAQGAWKQTGERTVHATFLDFNYDTNTPPLSVARVDTIATFSGKCTRVEGSFELRFFTTGIEDPLDPSSDTGSPITDTFTGRKVFPR